MLFYDLRLFKHCYKKVIAEFEYMRYETILLSRFAIKARVRIKAKNPGDYSGIFCSLS
jgi:hypothetical protein